MARHTRCPVVGVGTGLCGVLGEVLPAPPAFPLTEPLSLPEEALPPVILGPKVVKAETARLGELAQIGPSTAAAAGDEDAACGLPFWRGWRCCCWRRTAAWSSEMI